MISSLTYKMVAFPVVEKLKVIDCINWAIEMLELGYETPHLLMLAGFGKGSSFFEVRPYLEKSILELGFSVKDGDGGVASFVYFHIKEMAEGRNVRQNLDEIYLFLRNHDDGEEINAFCKLYWAWDYLDSEDFYPNYYWEGATKDNIKEIVIGYALNWLNSNPFPLEPATV